MQRKPTIHRKIPLEVFMGPCIPDLPKNRTRNIQLISREYFKNVGNGKRSKSI
jgi:hypothetical protein